MTKGGSRQRDPPFGFSAIAVVFAEQGDEEGRRLLTDAQVSVEQSSFDNWNGGTYGYTVHIRTPARRFAALEKRVPLLEKDLASRIAHFARAYPNEHVEAVIITPSLDTPTAGMTAAPSFWSTGDGMALPTASDGKSCTSTSSGSPCGCHSLPAFLKFPTSSFFFVSTEMTGIPRAMQLRAFALMCSN
jgi:hypothetical protein